MWNKKQGPSYLLVTGKYIASFTTNMSNFYISTVPLFHFILTSDQILRVVTFICRSLVSKAKGINSTENSTNLVRYKKMIEKALHNIIPRSLVEEAKGTISFVDKRSRYEIWLFNGEKLHLPPRQTMYCWRFGSIFFLFLCFSGPSREKKLNKAIHRINHYPMLSIKKTNCTLNWIEIFAARWSTSPTSHVCNVVYPLE